MVKDILKWLITEANCLLFGVRHVKGLYIGNGCKIVGSQRIRIMGGGKIYALFYGSSTSGRED